MNTLTINSKAALTLARAAEKARAEKPLVRKTSTYGVYEVRSTSNKSLWYTVTCNSETREITCNCPAQTPCKHIAAVAPLHVYIARQRQAASQAAQACTFQPVEIAKAQAEKALSLVELEDLIEQAKEKSLDRECPACGLVQPDDDSTDCWCCGSILNPEDVDPDPTMCVCGMPGFSYFNCRWHCISCIKDMQAKQAVTCKDCGAPATGGEGRCFECQLIRDSADLFGTPAPARANLVTNPEPAP